VVLELVIFKHASYKDKTYSVGRAKTNFAKLAAP
jgi:hypothetical protein